MIDGERVAPAGCVLDFWVRSEEDSQFLECVNFYGNEAAIFDSLQGWVTGLGHGEWLSHPYNYIELTDEANTMRLHLPRTSASFRDIVLLVHSQADEKLREQVCIELSHTGERGKDLYLTDWAGCALHQHGEYHVPTIKRRRDSETGKEWCDYAERLAYIDGLCEEVSERVRKLQRTRVH